MNNFNLMKYRIKFFIISIFILFNYCIGILKSKDRNCKNLSLANKKLLSKLSSFKTRSLHTLQQNSNTFYQNSQNKLSCPIVEAQELPKAKEWLNIGYDLLLGNPGFYSEESDNKLIDPGFKNPIFQYELSDLTTNDGLFKIPKGYDIFNLENSCNISLSSKKITTIRELTEEYQLRVNLSLEAEISAGNESIGANAAGKASMGYKDLSNEINSSDTIYIENTASCIIYKSNFLSVSPPKFTNDFLENLSKLNEKTYKDNKDIYYEFINTYGTHYLDTIYMGSKYSYISLFSYKYVKNYEKSGVFIEAGLSAELINNMSESAKAETSLDIINKEKSKTSILENAKSNNIISLGSPIPNDLNLSKWITGTLNSPMPIKYELKSILKLLGKENIKLIINNLKPNIKINDLITQLKESYKDYCNFYNTKNNSKINCSNKTYSKITEHYTNWDTFDSYGNIYFLKNHNVECDSNSALYSFVLQQPDNFIRYKYECMKSDMITNDCKLNQRTSINQRNNDGDDLTSFYNYKIGCEDGYVLKRFQYKMRDVGDYSYDFYYEYDCCKAIIEDKCILQDNKIGNTEDDIENFTTLFAGIDDSEYDAIQSFELKEESYFQIKKCKLKN